MGRTLALLGRNEGGCSVTASLSHLVKNAQWTTLKLRLLSTLLRADYSNPRMLATTKAANNDTSNSDQATNRPLS